MGRSILSIGFQVANEYSLNVNSTYNQFSPKWVHNLVVNNTDNSGAPITAVYEVLISNGAVRYSQFPPTSVRVADPSTEFLPWYLNTNSMETALKYRVANYEILDFAKINSDDTPITSYNSTCLDNMKTFLTDGKILTFTTDFGTNNSDWKYGILQNQSDSSLNGDYVCIGLDNVSSGWQGHAMAIVGYNDNISYDLNGDGKTQNYERGAFKVVNSHGADWKNDGFIWVLYDALNKVSNVNEIYTERKPVIEDYKYYVIDTKEYTKEVFAKVKLNHSERRQIFLRLGASNTNITAPPTTTPTLLLQNRFSANVNFSGTGTEAQDATFVFGFGELFNLTTGRKNCYIRINDSTSAGSTKVKEIELIDGTGKTILLDSEQKTISGATQTYRYKLGAVGDVNNDKKITASDATIIQKYASSLVTLSNEDLRVADVNGDGNVTTSDATAIQKYVAHIISEFENGSVALLD